MPQLNPNPWFLILYLTWLTYSLIIQPKISMHLPENNPTKITKPTDTNPWPWPWH
ncbi:ATP synthase F0 subunit 8 (mitochondrion) [Carettochelys insculpta]|uniref:ATP synthase complex subunit 8 n=1 Tax=Carettochelys insculpta TaxID=44489 RepID=D5FW26_CARIN|nr:ATP synthase F0 subunit 8 [Carettochelys insculpta]ACO83363.1 ATPase subunit 8 [Carettochelys insculpta]